MLCGLSVVNQKVYSIHVPDTQDRYYTVQLLDAWTNTFANIGRGKLGKKNGISK
ncbi:DUF1254 domain-containing protein [Bacillus sp. 3103sda1]|uniref:DUF1254 domain-containing protein n=1 Tax=Bacillus sp. 3103sda1 TaxID=2953808 RepID=UPI0035C89C75